MNKNVIIIGSGIGGISTALRLQNIGYKVTILEKNNFLGGKTSSIKFKSFNFDLTATLPILFKPYIELFNDINEDINKHIKIKCIDPCYKIFFNDGNSFNISSFIPNLKETISNIDEDDFENYLKLISNANNTFNLLNNNFINKSFFKTVDLINLSNIKSLINNNYLNDSCYSYLKDNLNSKYLIKYLLFQSMYVGISPYKSSSVFTTLPLLNHIEGSFYIEGGISAYINSLINIFKNRGGKILLNSEVTKILFNNNKCIGVEINKQKSLLSEITVCNADYPYAINNLLPKQIDVKNKYTEKDMSCSCFILHLALNKKIKNIGINNIILNKNFKENIEAPFNGILSSNPHLYVYCPTAIYKNSKYELLTINIRVPNLFYNKIVWDKNTINKLYNIILKILENKFEIKKLKRYIKFTNYLTPIDLLKNFNSYAGSSYGINHSINNLFISRPQCKIKNLKNLYFVGASTHPGSGVSMVLNSSKIAVSEIIKDNKK
ncbi:NAD(P)/FAD-dependent oxidoreductase [Clostridium sp. Ade.TY]|uniref:phytoene desaturase family protein n=1 Tax=Clostridium sp. Ade.TY TaxID=1391647 RepID=UPI00040D7D4C|nr:NAD(P)/FAD-dependent oxidoreductase [Clostridium sp. Ade.TY]